MFLTTAVLNVQVFYLPLLDQLIGNGNLRSNLVLNIENRGSILGVSDIEERK